MKKIFITDFDDTLFFTRPSVFEYISKEYGVKLDDNKYYSGNLMFNIVSKFLQGEYLDYEKFWKAYARDFLCSIEYHKKVEPFPDMVHVLTELSKKYEIHISTARQEVSKPTVEYLINKYIPNIISNIHHVWKIENNVYKPYYKHEYIQDLHGEKVGFIDDNPGEIKSCMDIIPSFLFDPNGLHIDEKSYKRISSWMEIQETFL
jgi:hypothetical protein